MTLPDPNEILQLLPDQLSKLVALGEPWLKQYGLASLTVGVALETFFLTGAFLPGYALIIAAGYLSAAGTFPIALTLICATLGAVAGDQLSYFLGRNTIAPLLKRHIAMSVRVGHAMQERGIVLLLLYHFSPLLRSLVPLACGHTRYPWRAFTLWSALGAFQWVTIVMAIGMLAQEAASSKSNVLLLAIDVFALILVVIVTLQLSRALRSKV